MCVTPCDLAGCVALSVSAYLLWRNPCVSASVLLGLPCVHLALFYRPRKCIPGLMQLVQLCLWATDVCAAVPWSVSGLLSDGCICALMLHSLSERVLFISVEML